MPHRPDDPEALQDQVSHLRRELAAREAAVRMLARQIESLIRDLRQTRRVLRDTSEGLSPSQRIDRACRALARLASSYAPPSALSTFGRT